jgi:hypothetical protein
MPEIIELAIRPDGEINAIYSDALVPLLDEGDSTVTRASSVEPCEGGGWAADLSPVAPGVVLTGYKLREDALRDEVKWLKENWLSGKT